MHTCALLSVMSSADRFLFGDDSAKDAFAAIDGRVMLAIVCAFGVSVACDNDHTKVRRRRATAVSAAVARDCVF